MNLFSDEPTHCDVIWAKNPSVRSLKRGICSQHDLAFCSFFGVDNPRVMAAFLVVSCQVKLPIPESREAWTGGASHQWYGKKIKPCKFRTGGRKLEQYSKVELFFGGVMSFFSRKIYLKIAINIDLWGGVFHLRMLFKVRGFNGQCQEAFTASGMFHPGVGKLKPGFLVHWIFSLK